MRKNSLSLLLFLSINCFGQPPADFKPLADTTAFKQKMADQAKFIVTIASDFTQEKYLSVMSEKIITKGHFFFKKVNMLRWEYTTPYKYIIGINKNTMVIKDNNKLNKYDINSNKMFKSINEMMLNMVEGNLLNDKNYTAKFYENNQHFLLELTPVQKKTKDFLKNIYLYVDKHTYVVVKVKITEPGDDYTLIEFTNRKINQTIADETFTIK